MPSGRRASRRSRLVLRIDSGMWRRSSPVEGAELHLVIMRAAVESIEVGNPVDAENHGLAIEREPLLPDLARGLNDPWIPVGPVVAASGDQANAVAVALQPEPVAVVLDLVEPVRAGGDA